MNPATELEYATVIWFNHEKRYGFARDGHGVQIFFHLNDGRHCKIENGELNIFARSIQIFGKHYYMPEPVADDVICFTRSVGSKGRDKASPWTFRYMEVDAWLDYERDQVPCSGCGHRMAEHAGWKCMEDDCHCGDEAYEHDEDEYREVNLGGDPGGFTIYE